MVDDEDYDYLSQFNWFARRDTNTFYASRNIILADGKKTSTQMHREILGTKQGVFVDHKDRNGLNNQKSNLREVTNAQNSQNTGPHVDSKTGIKGVSFERTRNRWRVNIMLNGKNKNIGRFLTLDQAIEARNKADKALHPFNLKPCGN